MTRRLPLAALAAACLAVAACGSDEDNNPEQQSGYGGGSASSEQLLPAEDVRRVQVAREAITRHCENPPDSAIRTLVNEYRAGPDRIFDSGSAGQDKSMTMILEEKRDELRTCGADEQAAQLDRALASGS
jgi:hypothetical protein